MFEEQKTRRTSQLEQSEQVPLPPTFFFFSRFDLLVDAHTLGRRFSTQSTDSNAHLFFDALMDTPRNSVSSTTCIS